MTKYYVYILFSTALNKHYCGQTYSLDKRLSEHNGGLVKSTLNGKPWNMLWHHEVSTRAEAMELEKKIKGRGIVRFLNDVNFGA